MQIQKSSIKFSITKSGKLTGFYIAGYFMQQHQASMEVIDDLLNRKLQRHFENTVVLPCPELKHKLLFVSTAGFAFVLLHGRAAVGPVGNFEEEEEAKRERSWKGNEKEDNENEYGL